MPKSWSCEPDDIRIHLDVHTENSFELKVNIPQDFRFNLPRLAIAADIVLNGQYLGQVVEAVVSCRDSQPNSSCREGEGDVKIV